MQKVDNIDALFNGVLTSFTLAISGVALSPGNTADLFVVYNGVAQEPNVDFIVNGYNIVFAVAPLTGRDCFIVYSSSTTDAIIAYDRIAEDAISGYSVVYELGNGRVDVLSYTDTNNTRAILGITSHAAVALEVVSVIRHGEIIDGTMGLTVGPYYLGLNGSISPIVPSTGAVVCVGYASTSGRLVVDMQPQIVRG